MILCHNQRLMPSAALNSNCCHRLFLAVRDCCCVLPAPLPLAASALHGNCGCFLLSFLISLSTKAITSAVGCIFPSDVCTARQQHCNLAQ